MGWIAGIVAAVKGLFAALTAFFGWRQTEAIRSGGRAEAERDDLAENLARAQESARIDDRARRATDDELDGWMRDETPER